MPDRRRKLTDKQSDALDLIARGLSQRQAAFALGISRRALRDRVGGSVKKLKTLPNWLYRWKRLKHTAQIP